MVQDGDAYRRSGSQLSLFVHSFVFIVCCTFVYLHYWTLQSSWFTGHRFPTEDDHLQQLSSHSQHSGRDSETSGISVDCYQVWKATQTVTQRKQKRGCRAGLLARLRKQPLKPLLPSLYLTNARPMVYKTDDLEIQLAGNRYVLDCCVLIITETWLRTKIPDATVQLAGRTLHRWDRNSDSRKSRGGGLCIYVHQGWCNNSPILDRHCSPDLEFMWVRCRPFFLR